MCVFCTFALGLLLLRVWGSVSSHGALKRARVFITFAHWWSLFRLWGIGLVSNMHMFCMGPSKTRVFLLFWASGPLWAPYFGPLSSWGTLLGPIGHP